MFCSCDIFFLSIHEDFTDLAFHAASGKIAWTYNFNGAAYAQMYNGSTLGSVYQYDSISSITSDPDG